MSISLLRSERFLYQLRWKIIKITIRRDYLRKRSTFRLQSVNISTNFPLYKKSFDISNLSRIIARVNFCNYNIQQKGIQWYDDDWHLISKKLFEWGQISADYEKLSDFPSRELNLRPLA